MNSHKLKKNRKTLQQSVKYFVICKTDVKNILNQNLKNTDIPWYKHLYYIIINVYINFMHHILHVIF